MTIHTKSLKLIFTYLSLELLVSYNLYLAIPGDLLPGDLLPGDLLPGATLPVKLLPTLGIRFR